MKYIFSQYIQPYYGRMSIGFVIKFLGTIMDLCIPYILAFIIDSVIPLKSKSLVITWGSLMILCSIFALLFNVWANRMASKVARNVTESIRHDLFSKVMYLSNSKSDEFTKPSLISRLTSDTYYVHQSIGMMQRLGIRAPILLIGGIMVTITLDAALACVLLAVMPILTIIIVLVSKKSIPLFSQLQEATDRFVRMVREDIGGIRVIKALSKTQYEKDKFDTINLEVVEREKKAGLVMASMNPAMNILLNVGLVLVILTGAYQVNRGASEVGKILAFMTYFAIILNALMMVSRLFTSFSKAIASSRRIEEVLLSEAGMDIEKTEKWVGAEEDYLVFDHVSFSYYGKESNLSDISFSLKKGETLGIIGATGAGKSTLAKLLLRLYDVSQGAIYINGTNIKSIQAEELHKKFGIVFQNDSLFEDSIIENVRLGRDLTEEQIWEALTYAKAREFVEDKSGGADEKLNIKGANLSGGQQQRILIARALAAHPEILVLDDSSSALDYKTDANLRKQINEHFQETTTIIIAQRISSILHADKILVLEDGMCLGYGTHQELMEGCSEYQEIAQSQMGGV